MKINYLQTGWRMGLWLALMLALWLGMALPAAAQDVTPRHTDPSWQGQYWNNPSLNGQPALVRQDNDLTFDWGNGSPDGLLPADNFSARWSRYIDVTPGTYLFSALADDGVRLFVDGQLVIDAWKEQAATLYTGTIYLGPGHHLVVVEYFERAGAATVKVSWRMSSSPEPTPIPATGPWRAEFFNNVSLSGTPVLVRNENEINYNWGLDAPWPNVPADGFSVRWSRSLSLPAGNYRFRLLVDDGARLFVNGHTLIDAWKEQPATLYTGDIYLPGGPLTVQLEYFDRAQAAQVQLSWGLVNAQPGPTPTPVPPSTGAVVVDDVDAGFVRGGKASGWNFVNEGYNGRLTWTQNNQRAQASYNWGRWYPSLRAGRYEVFVYIPDRYSTTAQARYWVSHAGGYTLRVVNQSANGGKWVSLGTYQFSASNSDYVSLADVTYEPYLSRLIAWDAAKWEPR